MENPLHGRLLFLIGSEASRAMSAGLWNPVLRKLGSTWHYEGWDVPAGSGMAGVRARLLADDVVAATQNIYSGRVEMGTDLTVIEVGDSINVRRPK